MFPAAYRLVQFVQLAFQADGARVFGQVADLLEGTAIGFGQHVEFGHTVTVVRTFDGHFLPVRLSASDRAEDRHGHAVGVFQSRGDVGFAQGWVGWVICFGVDQSQRAEHPAGEKDEMRDDFAGVTALGAEAQPVRFDLPCARPGRVGHNDIDAAGCAHFGIARDRGKGSPCCLREVDGGGDAGFLQPGDEVAALGDIGPKRFFQEDGFVGIGGFQSKGLSRGRWTGEVDDIAGGNDVRCAGGDAGTRSHRVGLGAGFSVRVPQGGWREFDVSVHVLQHAPSHDAQPDDACSVCHVVTSPPHRPA